MLPCHGCVYRESIPGDAHSRCAFAFEEAALLAIVKGANEHGKRRGWFMFPLNYDPTWGPNECGARSETRNSAKVQATNPLADMLSLMGKRL